MLSSYFLVISVILETPNAKFWGADRILILVLRTYSIFRFKKEHFLNLWREFQNLGKFHDIMNPVTHFFPQSNPVVGRSKKVWHLGLAKFMQDTPASGRSIKLDQIGSLEPLPKKHQRPSLKLPARTYTWKWMIGTDCLGMAQPGRCELLVSGSVNLSKNPLEVGTMTGCAPWRLWPCRLCVPPSRPMVWEQTACTEAREKKVEKPKKVGDSSENYVCFLFEVI